MAYIPNGNGLEAHEGFSVMDGSGYAIRRSLRCCQSIWPGNYLDDFNYTIALHAPSGITDFGTCMKVVAIGGGGPGGDITAASNGAITTYAIPWSVGSSAVQYMFYPKCESFPSLSYCKSQITWECTGDANPSPGPGYLNSTPCGVGGPAAFIRFDLSGNINGAYFLDLRNNVTGVFPSYDEHYNVTLQYFNGSGATTLHTSVNLYGSFSNPGSGGGGPYVGFTADPHILVLEISNSGSTNTINVYCDGTLLFTYTDSSAGIPTGGICGFQSGAEVAIDDTNEIETSKLSKFLVTT